MKASVTVKENGTFRRIYRKGASAVKPCMVVYCRKNRQGLSRLGVTVSTKLGGAVVRNRVRRQMREMYRLHTGEMVPGYDVIIVARSRSVRTPYHEMDRQYASALDALSLRERNV